MTDKHVPAGRATGTDGIASAIPADDCGNNLGDSRKNSGERSGQRVGLRQLRLPDGDEIAAGSELAERLDLSIGLGLHFHFIPDFNHISKIIHQQWSLSAKHPKSPKQKPNKNPRLPEFFVPVRCPP
jgi:hypothetical protein